ncbi:hypothetical protein M0804_015242, partial [Polistes exclamans]
MSTSKNNNPKCCVCSKFIKKVPGAPKHIESDGDAAKFSTIFNRPIIVGDILCSCCRVKKYKKTKLDDEETETVEENELTSDISDLSGMLERTESNLSSMTLSQSSSDDPSYHLNLVSHDTEECIEIQIERTVATHRYCCVCNISNTNLVLVPQDARTQCFIKRRIFIPNGNRCCRDHLIKKRFYEETLDRLKVFSNWSILRSSELTQLMENLVVNCDPTLLDKMDDFRISDEQLYIFTGLRRENIIEVRDLLITMRNTDSRTVTQAPIVFLFKLRTGNSISATLQLSNEQLVSKYCEQVIQSFEKDVLPRYFGFQAMSRADLVQNNLSPLLKCLYADLSDKLFLICDGTYARHQKSSNNAYQRKSFSGQKKV